MRTSRPEATNCSIAAFALGRATENEAETFASVSAVPGGDLPGENTRAEPVRHRIDDADDTERSIRDGHGFSVDETTLGSTLV